jgi:hypothetical protein
MAEYRTRTWPYGTLKTVRIVAIEKAKHKGKSIHVIGCVELGPDGEGHMLAGVNPGKVKVGDVRTMEFTRGGPLGGYWEILDKETSLPGGQQP